ncbi:MAG: hypothetical protein Q9182_001753 [Xanthomendoza sp. 2 TL-2023]
MDQELQENSRRECSKPVEQLTTQANAEKRWILEAFDAQRIDLPTRVDFDTLAQELWARYEWRWMHQESLQDGSENDVQSKLSPHNVFDDSCSQSTSQSDVHDLTHPLTAEQQIQRERDREASRPIHQFLWQTSPERDLIYGEPVINDAARSAPLDINTKAYESVKEAWIKRGVWDFEWGVMPGMTGMHERSKNKTHNNNPVHAHHRQFSFGIAEAEAEALRLKSERPLSPLLPQ